MYPIRSNPILVLVLIAEVSTYLTEPVDRLVYGPELPAPPDIVEEGPVVEPVIIRGVDLTYNSICNFTVASNRINSLETKVAYPDPV